MSAGLIDRLGQDWPLYTKRPVTIAAVKWDGEWRHLEAFVGANAHLVSGILTIHTLEGDLCASIGDYIVRGIKDEFYPVKPDIFEASYVAGRPPASAPLAGEAEIAEALYEAWDGPDADDPHAVHAMAKIAARVVVERGVAADATDAAAHALELWFASRCRTNAPAKIQDFIDGARKVLSAALAPTGRRTP
jgi:hypothetical protein